MVLAVKARIDHICMRGQMKEEPSEIPGYNIVEFCGRRDELKSFAHDLKTYGLVTALYNQFWLLFDRPA